MPFVLILVPNYEETKSLQQGKRLQHFKLPLDFLNATLCLSKLSLSKEILSIAKVEWKPVQFSVCHNLTSEYLSDSVMKLNAETTLLAIQRCCSSHSPSFCPSRWHPHGTLTGSIFPPPPGGLGDPCPGPAPSPPAAFSAKCRSSGVTSSGLIKTMAVPWPGRAGLPLGRRRGLEVETLPCILLLTGRMVRRNSASSGSTGSMKSRAFGVAVHEKVSRYTK